MLSLRKIHVDWENSPVWLLKTKWPSLAYNWVRQLIKSRQLWPLWKKDASSNLQKWVKGYSLRLSITNHFPIETSKTDNSSKHLNSVYINNFFVVGGQLKINCEGKKIHNKLACYSKTSNLISSPVVSLSYIHILLPVITNISSWENFKSFQYNFKILLPQLNICSILIQVS